MRKEQYTAASGTILYCVVLWLHSVIRPLHTVKTVILPLVSRETTQLKRNKFER